MSITSTPAPSANRSLALSLLFGSSPFILDTLKHVVFLAVLGRAFAKVYAIVRVKGVEGAFKVLVAKGLQRISTLARRHIPGANALVQKEVAKNVASMQAKITGPDDPSDKKYRALPKEGLSESLVRMEHKRYIQMGASGEEEWKSGKVSGAVYHGGERLSALLTEAYGIWTVSNPLHPEIFPAIRRMESEVVSMVLNMYNAPSTACGSVTSGGTESLLMAIKAYRDRARDLRGVTEPEMVIPVTMHAAFDKGADYFGVKIVHVPVDNVTGKVDLAKVEANINFNTIMLAGSSPNFPHGIVDDIPALAALAKKHDIGMHVDACLGGFIVPFVEKAGFPLPHYVDFRVDGVTSISADTHKYGFAPKGSSVIMYRTKELRNYQYFVTTEWPGGVYASPSIAGSRPGALIAGCWTAMIHMGESGYIETTKKIVGAARKVADGIRSIEGLRLIGEPLLSVVSFDSVAPLKIYGIGDLLSRKGWHLNMLQFPPAIHIACTLLTTEEAVQQLLQDIREAVDALRKDPNAGNGDLAAIYGTVASIPDRSVIVDVTRGFLDSLTLL
ncbi:hypothetical protein HDU97_001314 [Phlyctochytrium planicorne]|nr:hypothetical protein HDU97_001314 [Phlyctochytrium planicorne]